MGLYWRTFLARCAVKRAGESGCTRPIVVDGQTGLLASIVTEESRTGSAQCPWLIRVQSGQTVALTLIDFGLSHTPGTYARRFDGVTSRTVLLRSKGREFDTRSGRYQVVTAWTGDCLRTGKPSRYITNYHCQLSLRRDAFTCMCRLAGNTVWSHMTGDAP